METDSILAAPPGLMAPFPAEITTILIIGGGLLLLVVALLLLFRRPPSAGAGGAAELERLTGTTAELDARLRDATSRADRAETLAYERGAANEALVAEIAALRRRIDEGTAGALSLSAQISAHKARQQADAEALEERRAENHGAAKLIIELRGRVEEELRAQQALKAEIAGLKTRIEAERAAAEEKIALLSRIRDDMQERFRQLAGEALKVQGEAFGKANAERLEATLTPLKEHVGHFEKELREVHQETVKDRERLKAEIAQLTQRSEAISQEALALTRALKGDHQQQGAWGEMILESILERSGLREGEEYVTQAHRTGAEGERLRPDVVVMIPGGKTLVIDSKVSLNDYAVAVNAASDSEALLSRKRHVAAMRAHVNGLSAKSYQMAEGQSLDYVIMFVPIEGALSEALREDSTLTEYALERHITIATPTTLMMALRTVSHVWAVERRSENAEAIAQRAGLLYDKVANFVTSMERVGRGIHAAQGAYDTALGQLSRGSGNVLSQVEKLKALGARASKSIALEFEGRAEALALARDEGEPDAPEEAGAEPDLEPEAEPGTGT